MIKTDKNNLFCVKPNGYACAHNARACKPCGFRLLHYVRRLRSVPARFTQNKGKTEKNRTALILYHHKVSRVFNGFSLAVGEAAVY